MPETVDELEAEISQTWPAARQQTVPSPAVKVGPLTAGLAAAGALGLVIAQLLPALESQQFVWVAENTLIQDGIGWAFIAVAAGAVMALGYPRETAWVLICGGLLAIGIAAFAGFSEEARTLTPLVESGEQGTLTPGENEIGSAGIGIYASAIAGASILLAGFNRLRADGDL